MTTPNPRTADRRIAGETVGSPDQWRRVDRAAASPSSYDQRRAEAAIRNARFCGTDPSWYGF